MNPKFHMRVFGYGHTAAEVEASALNHVSALSGWQGTLRIAGSYDLQEIPRGDIGQHSNTAGLIDARDRGDTLYADIKVCAYDEQPKQVIPAIDMDELLAEALDQVEVWETSETGGWVERDAMVRLTECVSTLHHVLSHGGRLPRDWRDARSPEATAKAGT